MIRAIEEIKNADTNLSELSNEEFEKWWSDKYTTANSIWETTSEEEGLAKLLELETICQELGRKVHCLKTLKMIGVMHYRNYDFEQSIFYLKKALQIAENIQSQKEIITCHSMLATNFHALGLNDAFYEHNKKSLDLAYVLDSKEAIIKGLCNISHVYIVNQEYEKASEIIQEGFEINSQLSGNSPVYFDLLIVAARNYKCLKQYDIAQNYLKTIVEEQLTNNRVNDLTRRNTILIATMNEMTDCYYKQGKFEIALKNAAEVLQIAQDSKTSKSSIFHSYKNLGKVNYQLGNVEDAVTYLSKALSIELIPTFDKNELYEYLVKAHIKNGATKQAIQLLDEKREYNKKFMKSLSEFQARKYEYLQENERISTELRHKEKLVKKVEEMNESLQRFAQMAVHDLKEPLRTMKSFSSLLSLQLEEIDNATKLTYLDYIHSGASTAQRLLSDMYQYSRLGVDTMSIEAIDCNQLIKEILIQLDNQIQRNQVEIFIENFPIIYSAKSLLLQLFQNLISNALKFTSSNRKATVRISVKQKGEAYEFSISDNGIGIPEDKKDLIFQAFTKLNPKGKYEGSGLGLATCKKIVDSLQGNITVESTFGEGTTFKILLPNIKKAII